MEADGRHGPRDAVAMSDPAAAATALLDRLCTAWSTLALADIEALWDAGDARPTMLPQELERPLVGWPELRLYWTKAAARLEAASMRTRDLIVRPIADDLALILYVMHWNGAIRGFTRPVGVEARVSAVIRETAQGWRFIHYVEAPLSFSLQLQQRNALQADADFVARTGQDPDVLRPMWPDGTPL